MKMTDSRVFMAIAEGRQSPPGSRKPRHMLLSPAWTLCLGASLSRQHFGGPSEGTMAQQDLSRSMHDIVRRRLQGHMGARSTVRVSQTEAGEAVSC